MPKFLDVTDKALARAALGVDQVFDVTNYGATGNGTTDDTTAIHAARTAAGVGGKVYFPAGTYLVDGLNASVADQTWDLVSGAVVKMKTGSARCLKVSANGVTIDGGTFDASNGTLHDWSQMGIFAESVDGFTLRNATVLNSPKHGVYGTNCSDVLIEKCTILEQYNGGIFFQDSAGSPVRSGFRFLNNIVSSTQLQGSGISVKSEDGLTCKHVRIIGNHITAPRNNGQVQGLVSTWRCEDSIIDGNILDGGWAAITIPSPKRIVISNNIIRGFWKYGMELAGDLLDTTVTGNSIDQDGVGVADSTGIGGSAGTVQNLIVSDNAIGGFTVGQSFGIAFSQSITGLVVSGNAISNVSGRLDAIYLNNDTESAAITNNVIDTNSADPSYGIQMLNGDFAGVTITGNTFRNIVTKCINLSTTGSATFTDVTVTGNTFSNCGPTLSGAGATAGTRIVTDSTPPTALTATAAGTTVLTVDSAEVQVFTGTTTQNCHLPTTDVKLGQQFTVINNSTGVVTVKEGVAAATVATLAAGAVGSFVALQATPTTAAHWAHDLKVLSNSQVSSLRDVNGNTVVAFTPVASAVNYVELTNSSSTFPAISAAGTGANVNLDLRAKGTGWVTLTNSGSAAIARFIRVSSAVNYWEIGQSATGQPITATAAGTDSTININLIPKGATGVVQANGNPVGVKVAVPASAGATGVVGQWAADASWIYVCTAANTWVRGALATW